MASPSARGFPFIKAIRTFVVDGVGSGGDYHNVEGGHWSVPCISAMAGLMLCRLIDTPISTPMSRWEKYRASRTSWGINVLGSFCVEIEGSDGTIGFATGFGGNTRPLEYSTTQLKKRQALQHAGSYTNILNDSSSAPILETRTTSLSRCIELQCFMDERVYQ